MFGTEEDEGILMKKVTVVKFRKDVIHPYLARPDRDTIQFTQEIETLGTVLHVFDKDGVSAYKTLANYGDDDEAFDYYRVVTSGELDDRLQGLANSNYADRYVSLLNAFIEIGNKVDFNVERLAWRLEE